LRLFPTAFAADKLTKVDISLGVLWSVNCWTSVSWTVQWN